MSANRIKMHLYRYFQFTQCVKKQQRILYRNTVIRHCMPQECWRCISGYLEFQVSRDTPPTFLWHTVTDDCVPVENSLLFFNALRKLEIPVEMHLYPVGGHGLSLANEETSYEDGGCVQKECQSWMELACKWMQNI